MTKRPIKKAANIPEKKQDYDAGIRKQLEPYGLELNDIVAVLEEDPSLMEYVEQGEKGKSLADRALDKYGKVRHGPLGKCASRNTGVKDTVNTSSKATPIVAGNGNDIQLAAQSTQDYFTVTYHTAETADSLKYAPYGALFNWDNQDDQKNRTGKGGFAFGHTNIKLCEDTFFSDGRESKDSCVNLVLHKGRNGGPRYGSLSYVTFPKDVTFSPELIDLALMRKRERETDREIPLVEMPKQPNEQKMNDFLKKNPRLGYLMLKKVNPSVSFDFTVDGGAKLSQYYKELPKNSPERAALDLLVSKDIKNVMDYEQVNKTMDEVNNEVLRLRNPEAYARRQRANDEQLHRLCVITPIYIYQLQKSLTGDVKRMTSHEYKSYIANLDSNSPEYLAISELAKKGLKHDANPVEVKLAVANIAKNHRDVKPEEINSLFENTPALVYHVQKEFGTQKASGIRSTSELHKYYDSLSKDSRERKAIDELAMAHIELKEADTPKLGQAISEMAHRYKPDRELEPRPAVSLTPISLSRTKVDGADVILGRRSPKEEANRNAIRSGLKKMDEKTWETLVDTYIKSTQKDKKPQREEMKRQKEEADKRFETVLQSLFVDDGKSDCKKVVKQSRELFDKYMKLDAEKSLGGFVEFVASALKEGAEADKQIMSSLIIQRGGKEK